MKYKIQILEIMICEILKQNFFFGFFPARHIFGENCMMMI